MSSSLRPEWETYERLIARMVADQLGTDLCVTPNARVHGGISHRSRQLDVLIESRHDREDHRRIIVDAKTSRRKINVKDVETFLGLMEDVAATHGYLVCPSGYTKAAELRAQTAVLLRLIPLDRLKDFDPSTWPECRNSRCIGGRVFWDGYPELSLNLRQAADMDAPMRLIQYVHYVGKCDKCLSFHVHCVSCGQVMMIPENDPDDVGHQCHCEPPWFWLASIETSTDGRHSAELFVVLANGNVLPVDRKAI